MKANKYDKDLDEWLEDDFNNEFYEENSEANDSDDEWIWIFNTSYSLLDEIQKINNKPTQAVSYIKDWYNKCGNRNKISVLSFVIDYLECEDETRKIYKGLLKLALLIKYIFVTLPQKSYEMSEMFM
jgi:hypothetical protein